MYENNKSNKNMAKEYKVHSKKLQEFLAGIENEQLRERYQMFFSLHEHIHYQYSKDNSYHIDELRGAVEGFCKLLIFVYVPNPDQLFDNADLLLHTYYKVNEESSIDYLKIKEEAKNALPNYKYRCDRSDLGQLAGALLCKIGEKEDGRNRIYNKIIECYKNLYTPITKDKSHVMPVAKQSPFDAPTLYSYYFSWIRSMIDLCSDKLSCLKDLLPFENTIIEKNVKIDIELEELISEDDVLKELYELEGDFKHEYGKKYVLVVSSTIKSELKTSLARIGWNMVVDFDPSTQAEGGLYNIIKKKWNGKRQMFYSSVETNGDKITYWVEANGNTNNAVTYQENQPKQWRNNYLPKVEAEICKLSIQKPEGEIVVIDLYSQSKFPKLLYKSRAFPKNSIIIRFLYSEEERIDEETKNEEINAELIKEYVVGQSQLVRYFSSLHSNILECASEFTSGCSDITVADVNKLAGYGIECVPVIPLSQEKISLDLGFCSGNRITWSELYSDIDVKRNGYDNFYKKISENVKRGDKFVGYISHDPCSGGTTVARRLAYDLMNKDPYVSAKCYVIFLSDLKSTSTEVFKQIKALVEDDKLPPTRMLIIFVDRTISDEKVDELRKSYISPTNNVSMVRVTYNCDSIPKGMPHLSIKEFIMPNEKPDFNRLYERRCPGISGMYLENVIDFPLSLKDFKNTQSVDAYVQELMKKIDLKYRDSVQHFSILVSVASLYVYDYDRYVTTGFTDSVFENLKITNIWHLCNLMSKSSNDAFGKLFDAELNDEGKRTGRIRPRFSLFARSFIKNSHIGICDIAVDYLKHVSKWDGSDKMKYVLDVFLKRPDFETDESRSQTSLNDKVSSFFKDNKLDPGTILEIYKVIVRYFPYDKDCLLSYSQFLYNKAYFEDKEPHNGQPFEESENILLELLHKNGDLFDSLVYQSLGVLYYRKIGVLRYMLKIDSNTFSLDHYKYILQYCSTCVENCDMSTELDPTSAYGLVTKAQMLKAVLNVTKEFKQYKDWTFCETDKIYQDMYLNYLEACSKIAKHIPEETKDTRISSDYNLIDRFNRLDDFRKKLNGGEGKDFFAKYEKKWVSTKDERLKIIYGCRLYDTIISSKRKEIRACINSFDDTYISRIEEATRYNARNGVSGAYEKLLNLIIFNSRTNRTIEYAIELVKEWEKSAKSNEEYLWINYYFMVFYAVQILNKGHANEGLMKCYNEVREKTSKYCKAADQKEYDTIPYLYYRASNSQGLDSVTEDKDQAGFVQGTINYVQENNRRRGVAKLDCGLMASFAAKDKKFGEADINVTRLKGIIGFRFNGLGLYRQDIISESIDEEARDDSTQTENFSEANNDENSLSSNSNTTAISIKQVGYVDLSTIKDGSKKKFVPENLETDKNQKKEQEYEGVIVLENHRKKIKCDLFPYPLPIEGCDLKEFYEDDDVIFVVKSRPQDKNPSKPYNFATDLRLNED